MSINVEAKVLWNAVGGTGYLITFSEAKAFVQVNVTGGAYFIRFLPPGDPSIGVIPTDPTPANGTVLDGWLYLADGQSASVGPDQSSLGTRKYSTKQLAVFCKASGTVFNVVT